MRSNGRHRFAFLRPLLDDLRCLSDNATTSVTDDSQVERYLGDLAFTGRGEILILC